MAQFNHAGESEAMPAYITGKVMMADGSPLPGSINIERVCGSSSHLVAYTDSGGQFSFQWGETRRTVTDVSESTFANSPDRSPFGCEIRAALPGYRADSISLDSYRALESPNVGVIVLHRLANVEGSSVSVTSLAAPPQAKKLYIKGLQSAHRGNFPDAGKNLEKAVSLYPRYANAWLDLAKVRMHMQLLDPAREAFLKALEADNKLVEAHTGLGMIAIGARQWADAAKYLNTALRLDPVDFPRIWYLDAIANYNAGNLDAAKTSVYRARKADPQGSNPEEDRLPGIILAVRGE